MPGPAWPRHVRHASGEHGRTTVDTVAIGLTWDDRRRRLQARLFAVLLAAVVVAVPLTQVAVHAATRFAGTAISVIVRGGAPDQANPAAAAVTPAGGPLGRQLGPKQPLRATSPTA